MMKIAFYKGKDNGLAGKLIRWISRSDISHCAMIFSDGTVFSATGINGVIFEDITDEISLYEKDWLILDIPWITEEQEDTIGDFCMQEEGSEYDTWGVFFGWINPLYQHPDKWFCSELCRDILLPFTKGLKDRWLTPAELYRSFLNVMVLNKK